MRITISKENYLKAIAESESEGEPVIAATLARRLQVSPPAVTMAVRRLRRDGLIRVNANSEITLAREGREIAQALVTAPGDDAGILLTNFPPRGWLDHEALRKHRARRETGRHNHRLHHHRHRTLRHGIGHETRAVVLQSAERHEVAPEPPPPTGCREVSTPPRGRVQ